MLKKFHIFASLSILLSVVAGSCSDDLIHSDTSSSASIRFNVSVAQGGWSKTRSGSSLSELPSAIMLGEDSKGDTLFLHQSISDYPEMSVDKGSRSSMVSSQDEMYSSFHVSAYQYTDTWDADHVKTSPNYFESETAVKTGNYYTMSPVRYWPDGGKMRFLAHAPADDSSFTFYPVDDADRGPRVHINIAEDIKNQNDLLISYSNEISVNSTNESAPMNFKHALTGIRFICDSKMTKGIITNITLSGVRYEGDFFYNMQDASQASSSDLTIDSNFNGWELYDKSFSLDLDHKVAGTDDEQITDGENTFLMFPQTLPDSAKVHLTIEQVDASGNPTGKYDKIVGSLAGRTWPAGKIVTYKISTSAQILEVEEPAVFNYLGSVYDTSNDSIHSFNSIKVASSAGNKNMKWKVEYQDDGASAWSETSSWLSIDPTWSWTDAPEQEVRFVAKSTYNSIDIDANLKNASAKGTSASPYNLASATGSASVVENTANSYIVDAPGYYILPLVYGNSIKDSQTYAKAYAYGASADTLVLSNFVNHLGNNISAPYIVDNAGCVPDHAGIVWQDAQNLVKDVTYVPTAYSGKGGVSFYVDPSVIKQGNAVVYISDKDNIMWSWQIWVTSFDGFESTVDLVNQDKQTFTVMPVNLGWCSNGENVRYYPKRSCKVRFTPTEGDMTLSQEVTFTQESHTSIPFGNNPYYQWGRKDPFVGSNIAWGNKERWDGNGTYYSIYAESNPPRLSDDLVEGGSRLKSTEALHLCIQNPDKWHNVPAISDGNGSYTTTNTVFSNLWGDNTLSYSKTVYDPCPVGYQVNYFYTYTGFLDSGYDWKSDKGIEFVKETASDWDSSNLAEFYTDSSKLHTITFPVSGYRDWNNKASVTDFKVRGFIWLRGTVNSQEAYFFRYAAHQTGVANVAPCSDFYSTDGCPVRPAVSQ